MSHHDISNSWYSKENLFKLKILIITENRWKTLKLGFYLPAEMIFLLTKAHFINSELYEYSWNKAHYN